MFHKFVYSRLTLRFDEIPKEMRAEATDKRAELIGTYVVILGLILGTGPDYAESLWVAGGLFLMAVYWLSGWIW